MLWKMEPPHQTVKTPSLLWKQLPPIMWALQNVWNLIYPLMWLLILNKFLALFNSQRCYRQSLVSMLSSPCTWLHFRQGINKCCVVFCRSPGGFCLIGLKYVTITLFSHKLRSGKTASAARGAKTRPGRAGESNWWARHHRELGWAGLGWAGLRWRLISNMCLVFLVSVTSFEWIIPILVTSKQLIIGV